MCEVPEDAAYHLDIKRKSNLHKNTTSIKNEIKSLRALNLRLPLGNAVSYQLGRVTIITWSTLELESFPFLSTSDREVM